MEKSNQEEKDKSLLPGYSKTIFLILWIE